MHVLVSILIIIALVFGVMFFLPDACAKDNTGNGGGTGNNGDGTTPPTYEDGTGDTGVNVTTGKIEVDITDVDGASVVGKKLDFAGEDENTIILFQPGDTYYTEGFKIKNNGNVKMAYKMFVSRQDDMDMLKFSEAFDFYVTTDPENLENAVRMLEFSGVLDVGQSSETFYIVVSMNEEAGNEFMDLTFSGIGITVNATQVLGE